MASGGNTRYQFRYGHEPGVCVYEGYVTFSSTVAGTAYVKGCSSTLTLVSTGAFYLTLNRPAQALRSFQGQHYASAGAVSFIQPYGTPATLATALKTGTIGFIMRHEDGTETAPVANDNVWLHFTVGTSAAGAR